MKSQAHVEAKKLFSAASAGTKSYGAVTQKTHESPRRIASENRPPCLLVGHRDVVDDHLAVCARGIALREIRLRVAARLEIAARGAHVVSVNILVVVVALNAAV